ncbi:hypothetical protein BaRGS_00018612 [Batillaria attramentaria]|uniref:MAM domain-containing protein n=1 Tax=Batillaria attramentaria TaxID=370345 RepID=A0ABD0KTD1_9CAEN
MSSPTSYVAVFFAVVTVVVASNEDCIGAEAVENGGVWTRKEGYFLKTDMSRAGTGDTAGLFSRTICATQDKTFRLTFAYYLQSSGNCMLSVSVNASGTKKEVWNTLQASHPGGLRWATHETRISSPGAPFLIIFEATRLTRVPCGYRYNEIDLDDISFDHVGFLPATTATVPSTAAATSLRTDPQTTSDYTTDLPPSSTNQTFRNG